MGMDWSQLTLARFEAERRMRRLFPETYGDFELKAGFNCAPKQADTPDDTNMELSSSSQPTQNRAASTHRYDIDWLRVIAIFLLIPFHAGRIFDADGFYIKNAALSPVIEEGIHFFLGQWRLALLFVLSGIGTFYALKRRTMGQYLLERTTRLFLPLVAGILLVVPPQIYYRNLFEGRIEGSYLSFYPTFFRGISPEGNFEWAHLWFLAYLFVYATLVLPLFVYLRSDNGQVLVKLLVKVFRHRCGIYLLAIPLALGELALRGRFNGMQTLIGDWANLLFYGLLFIYGYLLVNSEDLFETLRLNRRTSLMLALCLLTSQYAMRWTLTAPENSYAIQNLLWVTLAAIGTWFWICTFLGYAQVYFNRDSRLLQFLVPLIYPVYIFHQTLIVAIGFYAIQWPIDLWSKFFIICLTSLALSLTAAYLSNTLSLTRSMFGGPRSRKLPRAKTRSIS